MHLDKNTRRTLKLYKQAQKLQRKMARGGTPQQRNSWKRILAKAYRQFPTRAEERMREPLEAIGFKPQVLLHGYIADFACERYQVIVEIDGKVHEKRKEYDQFRDLVLQSHGWRVIRFTNEDVSKSPKAVVNAVLELL